MLPKWIEDKTQSIKERYRTHPPSPFLTAPIHTNRIQTNPSTNPNFITHRHANSLLLQRALAYHHKRVPDSQKEIKRGISIIDTEEKKRKKKKTARNFNFLNRASLYFPFPPKPTIFWSSKSSSPIKFIICRFINPRKPKANIINRVKIERNPKPE